MMRQPNRTGVAQAPLLWLGGALLTFSFVASFQGCGASKARPDSKPGGSGLSSSDDEDDGSDLVDEEDQDASVSENTDAFVYWPDAVTPIDQIPRDAGTDSATPADAATPMDAYKFDVIQPPDAREYVKDGVNCGGTQCGVGSTEGYACCLYGAAECDHDCGPRLYPPRPPGAVSLRCNGPEDCGGNYCCHMGGTGDGNTECGYGRNCGGHGVACNAREDCGDLGPYSHCCQGNGWTTHVCTNDPGVGNCL